MDQPNSNGLGEGRIGRRPALCEMDSILSRGSRGLSGRGFRRMQISRSSRALKGVSVVQKLVGFLEYLFGCRHRLLSRVFTLQGESYRVCCDCGAKYAYSLETMSIERRVSRRSAPARFRIA